MTRIIMLAVASISLGACASGPRGQTNPAVAFEVDPLALMSSTTVVDDSYRIGTTDLLKITVFQVPDLSSEETRVDAAGNLQLPLVGSIRAAGLTPEELSNAIADRLRAQYLRNPQVSVTIAQAASQKVTVDGAVTKPGVYEMRGKTTLLQALAMAEGPTNVADLKKVAVFRVVEGRRMVGVFDLAEIRNGLGQDPVLQGDDIVVVDTSRLSSAMREIVSILPGIGAFAYF